MARKSNRAREKKKVINTAYKNLSKKFEKKRYDISVNNLIFTFFNMFSTEYIRYTGKDRRDLMAKCANIDKRYEEVKKHYKNDSLFSINLDYYYKKVFAYLKGVNDKIGDINNYKDHNALLSLAEIEFEASRKELLKNEGKETLFQFLIGDEASSFIGHLTYCVVTIDRLMEKTSFEKSIKRYLKTTVTKMKKVKEEIENEVYKVQEYYIENPQYLKRHDRISYLLYHQCKLAGIEAKKEHKKLWNSYAVDLSNSSDEILNLYFKDTIELNKKYEKTKFIKKAS